MTRGPAADPDAEAALIAAWRAGDVGGMSGLYRAAARAETAPDRRAFLLTQAWICALDAGLDAASVLERDLKALGRA